MHKTGATSPLHQYKAVALPDKDPAGLKGEDTHRMNREDDQIFVLHNRLDEFNSIILTKLNKTVEKCTG